MYFTGNAKTQMKRHVDAHKGTLQAETFFLGGGTSILMFSSLNILGEPPPTRILRIVARAPRKLSTTITAFKRVQRTNVPRGRKSARRRHFSYVTAAARVTWVGPLTWSPARGRRPFPVGAAEDYLQASGAVAGRGDGELGGGGSRAAAAETGSTSSSSTSSSSKAAAA